MRLKLTLLCNIAIIQLLPTKLNATSKFINIVGQLALKIQNFCKCDIGYYGNIRGLTNNWKAISHVSELLCVLKPSLQLQQVVRPSVTTQQQRGFLFPNEWALSWCNHKLYMHSEASWGCVTAQLIKETRHLIAADRWKVPKSQLGEKRWMLAVPKFTTSLYWTKYSTVLFVKVIYLAVISHHHELYLKKVIFSETAFTIANSHTT